MFKGKKHMRQICVYGLLLAFRFFRQATLAACAIIALKPAESRVFLNSDVIVPRVWKKTRTTARKRQRIMLFFSKIRARLAMAI
jgi:hypothetical protein